MNVQVQGQSTPAVPQAVHRVLCVAAWLALPSHLNVIGSSDAALIVLSLSPRWPRHHVSGRSRASVLEFQGCPERSLLQLEKVWCNRHCHYSTFRKGIPFASSSCDLNLPRNCQPSLLIVGLVKLVSLRTENTMLAMGISAMRKAHRTRKEKKSANPSALPLPAMPPQSQSSTRCRSPATLSVPLATSLDNFGARTSCTNFLLSL